tara:strand:+ start:6376 stop:6621 length:246 start_codon:yes stop_codon:yes gene_type:complete
MSTELRDVPGTDISQTRFAGGKDRGAMLQLTVSDRGSFQTIQLTREECLSLAQELILFANGKEEQEVSLENFQRSFVEMSA